MAYRQTKILTEIFNTIGSSGEKWVVERLFNSGRKGASNAYMLKVIKKYWFTYVKKPTNGDSIDYTGFNKIHLPF